MSATLWLLGAYALAVALLFALSAVERSATRRMVRRWRKEADEAMNGHFRREQARRYEE